MNFLALMVAANFVSVVELNHPKTKVNLSFSLSPNKQQGSPFLIRKKRKKENKVWKWWQLICEVKGRKIQVIGMYRDPSTVHSLWEILCGFSITILRIEIILFCDVLSGFSEFSLVRWRNKKLRLSVWSVLRPSDIYEI